MFSILLPYFFSLLLSASAYSSFHDILIAIALQCIETWFYFIDAFRQLNDTADAGKWSLRIPCTFFYFKDVLVYLVESSDASQLCQ